MPRGGKRPGAGRKRKIVKDWQAHNLDIFREVLDDEAIQTIARVVASRIQSGDAAALKVAMPYIFGPPPQKVEHDVDVQGKLRIVIDE